MMVRKRVNNRSSSAKFHCYYLLKMACTTASKKDGWLLSQPKPTVATAIENLAANLILVNMMKSLN
jgi:hypothetical protein